MSAWSALLKIGGGTAKAAGRTVAATGRAIANPRRAVAGAAGTVKTAAVGAATGYVAWEKLTTDKSVARIMGDAVIGENAVNTVAGAAQDVKELKDKAGDAVEAVNHAVGSAEGKWNGVSNFFRSMFTGQGGNMFSNFFGNIGRGNVSGLGILGLVAAAFMVFGRFGWMGKIAGALLGMLVIGNNSGQSRTVSDSPALQTALEETSGERHGYRR